jgi:hypothetical protein
MMTRTDLDHLLASAAAPLSPALRSEASRVAGATILARPRRGRDTRSRWSVPFLVGGALALTAGAGTATIAMSHWGGVSMPAENVRNSQPIPVTWTTETGHQETCRVWIELRNPSPGDGSVLDTAIATSDWSGLGQRLYDTTPSGSADDLDGESRVSRALTPVVRSFATETFPGVRWFNEGADTDARAVDAWGMTCTPGTD